VEGDVLSKGTGVTASPLRGEEFKLEKLYVAVPKET
jgi:hypothetical protein